MRSLIEVHSNGMPGEDHLSPNFLSIPASGHLAFVEMPALVDVECIPEIGKAEGADCPARSESTFDLYSSLFFRPGVR